MTSDATARVDHELAISEPHSLTQLSCCAAAVRHVTAEMRTGFAKATPVSKHKATPKPKATAARTDNSSVHTLLDLFKSSTGGAISAKGKKGRKSAGGAAAAAAAGLPHTRKKQVIRRGVSSDDSDSECRSENEYIDARSAAAASGISMSAMPAPKKGAKKNNAIVIEEEEDLSEEERRQSALRREQKKLNMARAAAGEDGPELAEGKKQEGAESEEDVRCCLCHSADSDESNPIVMCDGPCGQKQQQHRSLTQAGCTAPEATFLPSHLFGSFLFHPLRCAQICLSMPNVSVLSIFQKENGE